MVARGEINASSSKSFAKRVCSRLNLKSKHCFEISELIFVVLTGNVPKIGRAVQCTFNISEHVESEKKSADSDAVV